MPNNHVTVEVIQDSAKAYGVGLRCRLVDSVFRRWLDIPNDLLHSDTDVSSQAPDKDG